MDTRTIDEAIDKYVHERMEKGKKKAVERFLSYVYLRHGGEECREFMKKVGGLSRYYMDFLRVMENPFRGPEMAWLASMLVIGAFSCYLMSVDDEQFVGICVFAGTIVNGGALIRLVFKKWSDVGVMIAIYREIAEIADNEISTPA
ncbi:MAG: hypothetical protein CXR31_13405 [Geobacter sp.]|nr:MAG: hypothetical protein CXR31_13405 [Geobacter sp.]